jgi:hypothetical protein
VCIYMRGMRTRALCCKGRVQTYIILYIYVRLTFALIIRSYKFLGVTVGGGMYTYIYIYIYGMYEGQTEVLEGNCMHTHHFIMYSCFVLI